MKLEYYEFKILLDDNDESLAFHAYIANKKSYRIVYDLNDTYTEFFKEIKNGTLSVKYCDNEKYFSGEDTSFKTFSITGENSLDNIRTFQETYENIYDFKILFEESTLQPQIGFIFDGPDYSLADGMAPDALSNTSDFQNKMYKTLKAANNIDFGDAFMEQPKAGSIDLNIHTTKTPNLENLKVFLESIKNKSIDRELLSSDTPESKLFKKIVKQLLELKKFDNLRGFTFKLCADSVEFSRDILDYLFIEGANLYGEDTRYENVIISHAYTLKNGNTSSLVIDSERYGTINCHFEYSLDKVKRFNMNSGKRITVSGIKVAERTIDLENFDIHT